MILDIIDYYSINMQYRQSVPERYDQPHANLMITSSAGNDPATTAAIAKIIDPKRDIYVTGTHSSAKRFVEDILECDCAYLVARKRGVKEFADMYFEQRNNTTKMVRVFINNTGDFDFHRIVQMLGNLARKYDFKIMFIVV